MKTKKEEIFSIGYFGGTDVLRFICAAGVIFHHSSFMLGEKGAHTHAEKIFQFAGSFFLDVFFVISGFLITLILMRELQAGVFSIKNFYIRRIIRIWPLYFLVVLVKIWLLSSLSGVPAETIRTNLAYALTFTVNFQVLAGEIGRAS